jgi:hypothetical protein
VGHLEAGRAGCPSRPESQPGEIDVGSGGERTREREFALSPDIEPEDRRIDEEPDRQRGRGLVPVAVGPLTGEVVAQSRAGAERQGTDRHAPLAAHRGSPAAAPGSE